MVLRTTRDLRTTFALDGRASPQTVGPFGLAFDGSDNLRVRSYCSVAGVALVIMGRWVDANGERRDFQFEHAPNADRSVKQTDHPLGAGVLEYLVVRAVSGTIQKGQCYAIVQVIAGLSGATLAIGQLLGGYVSSNSGLAWPGSPIEGSTEGSGVLLRLDATPAGAGIDIFKQCPTNTRWRLRSMSATFVCSALAANRRTYLQHLPTVGAPLWRTYAPQTMTASQAWTMTFAHGFAMFSDATIGFATSPLPEWTVFAALEVIVGGTSGMQPNDQYTAVDVGVEEWLDVD